jgi:hypothetical protein
MSLKAKQLIIASLGILFLVSLVFVQWMEVARKQEESGLKAQHVNIPDNSAACIECHRNSSPGIIDHWTGSTHAAKGIGCVECHQAEDGDADAFTHYDVTIATVVTPLDCSRCHPKEFEQFERSHHAKGGNILASLDNRLAETIEGNRVPFNPHSPTPGRLVSQVDGMASVNSGCKQCHGSEMALEATDGSLITVKQLKPDAKGKPTNTEVLALIKRNEDKDNQPVYHASTWPNTGIGRINLDGSLGSCSACHSRHDFSPRRARQPENCGKCHLGPDHPQMEIYEESKHGVAFRDLKEHMNLDATEWVLGKDYTQAPTCATCHMSRHSGADSVVTHDPGERISWTNRPPISLVMDTDDKGQVVTTTDPAERRAQVANTWQEKRQEMQEVCKHCHTPNYVHAFYTQYDEFVINYNEKFAKPGTKIMTALLENNLRTKPEFDEEIEWTWFYLWHHEGRRARHGASMMAPDYAHWHGMYEVAERFYMELIPQAREMAEEGREHGNAQGADAVLSVIDEILALPEHEWFQLETKKLHAPGKTGEAAEAAGETATDAGAEAKEKPSEAPAEGPDPAAKEEASVEETPGETAAAKE